MHSRRPAAALASPWLAAALLSCSACSAPSGSSSLPGTATARGASSSSSSRAPAPSRAAAPASEAPSSIILSIVGTSDVHGHVESLPVLGAYVAALRAARGGDDGVLLVDAGDMFQGTLDSNLGEGAAMVRAYDALRYDAAAFGNHEFDFGPTGPHATAEEPGEDPQGALKARATEAHFPMLTANVDDGATGKPVGWPNVRPSVVVKKRGDVVVGLIGVTSEDTPHTTIAANFSGLRIEPLASSVGREAAALRRAGANVVVLLAHAGGDCKDLTHPDDLASCDPKSEIMHLVNELPRGSLDAVVAGHTHAAMSQLVAGVPIIQSYSAGRAFGRVDLSIDPRTKNVVGARLFPPTSLRLPATYEGHELSAPDATVASVIAPDIERARVKKEQKLGVHLESAITRNHKSESAEGNLFADLMLAAHPDADVALTNGGGLRADLPAGDLTYGQLFEAMPFDNRFAIVKITGRELRAMLRRNLMGDSGILSVSGVRVEATCRPASAVGASGGAAVDAANGPPSPGGASAALDIRIVREPSQSASAAITAKTKKNKGLVLDDDPIVLVTSDFLATGGDSVGVASVPTIEPTLIRDALERGLRAHPGELRPSSVYDTGHRRIVYPTHERPVTCP